MERKEIHTHKNIRNDKNIKVLLQHSSESEEIAKVDYEHKDDYYIFFFLQRGIVKLLIDFKEIELVENTVFCIIPGQVHSKINYSDVEGWFLAIDPMFVKDEYKEVFNKLYFLNNKAWLSPEKSEELMRCISLANKKYRSDKLIVQRVFYDLVSSYIGMIAEIYQKGFPGIKNNRFMEITSRFKALLSANYRTMKGPNQYASEMKISSVYLNEAVKSTTGFSVRDCIKNEIVIQAKRLLFYTNLTIKEIALDLGYDDWAYFTRMFTKSTKLTPSQFRGKYLK